MNSKQAKALSLPDLMTRLGYQPTKVTKGGREYWYKSPFRDEKDASFHTSYLGGKWIWNDFGDEGGTVIDFVLRLKNYSRVAEALAFLRNLYPGSLFDHAESRAGERLTKNTADIFSFQQQAAAGGEKFSDDPPEYDLEFIVAYPIKNPVIHTYLEKERKIPKAIADLYLEEVRYLNKKTGKEYFAFGMKNQSGGYEIRAASSAYTFKSVLITRDITLIEGSDQSREGVNIFEGMVDYLSLLVLLHVSKLRQDAIIMHSLTSFTQATETIEKNGYKKIFTFLDNNAPGFDYTARFKECFPGRVVSKSPYFRPHVDINDALKAGHIPDFSNPAPPWDM